MDLLLEGKRKQGKEEESGEESDRPWKQPRERREESEEAMEIVAIDYSHLQDAAQEVLEFVLFRLPVDDIYRLSQSSDNLRKKIESNDYLWKTIQYADMEYRFSSENDKQIEKERGVSPGIDNEMRKYENAKIEIEQFEARNEAAPIRHRMEMYYHRGNVRMYSYQPSVEMYAFLLDETSPFFSEKDPLSKMTGFPDKLAIPSITRDERPLSAADQNAPFLLQAVTWDPPVSVWMGLRDKTNELGEQYYPLMRVFGRNRPDPSSIKLRTIIALNKKLKSFTDGIRRTDPNQLFYPEYDFYVQASDLFVFYDSGVRTLRITRDQYGVPMFEGSKLADPTLSSEHDVVRYGTFPVTFVKMALGKTFPFDFFANYAARERGYTTLKNERGSLTQMGRKETALSSDAWKRFVSSLPEPTRKRTSTTAVYLPASLFFPERANLLANRVGQLSLGLTRKDLGLRFERTPRGEGMY